MKFVECNEIERYRIKETRIEVSDGVNILKFVPGAGRYFLIVAHQHGQDVTMEEVEKLINEEYNNKDEKFLTGEYKIYDDNKKVVIYCISEAVFTQHRRNFKINRSDIEPDSPYQLEVYVADVKENMDGGKDFIAYIPDSKCEYKTSIPVRVSCVCTQGKEGGFLKKKVFYETISIKSRHEDYNDGEFEYTIAGVSGVRIPITRQALKSTMIVTVDSEHNRVKVNVNGDVTGIYNIE